MAHTGSQSLSLAVLYRLAIYNSVTGQSGRIVKLAINICTVVRKYMCIKYYVGRGYA